MMLLITFDSNVWQPVVSPSKFQNDPMFSSFTKIHSALQNGQIEGRLSETVFTLEGIVKKDRKEFLSKYEMKFEKTQNTGIDIGFSIGSDLTAHPGNNYHLDLYLNDALSLGFKVMRCYRIGGITNPDIKEDYYVQTSIPVTELANKFAEVGEKIEVAGAGIAWAKAIGIANAKGNEHWSKGLDNGQATKVASAVAEWADGDMVSAHVAYQNHYICTRDAAKNAGKNSVFSQANRTWLQKDYDIKFVSPEELANLI